MDSQPPSGNAAPDPVSPPAGLDSPGQASVPPPGAQPPSTTPLVSWAPPPPPATGPQVPGAPGLSFADTVTRIVAYVIDIIILSIIGYIVARVAGQGQITFGSAATGNVSTYNVSTTTPAVSLILFAIGALYFVLSWSGGRRATLGQRLFHIQVGNAFDGRPLSLAQAVRRWFALGSVLGLLSFVPSVAAVGSLLEIVWIVVILISTATSPTRQGIHDRFANSAVVRPSGEGRSGLATACVVVIALFLIVTIIGVALFFAAGPTFLEQLSRMGRPI
jgi:uncharacterized RDD family membrane protein YckC